MFASTAAPFSRNGLANVPLATNGIPGRGTASESAPKAWVGAKAEDRIRRPQGVRNNRPAGSAVTLNSTVLPAGGPSLSHVSRRRSGYRQIHPLDADRCGDVDKNAMCLYLRRGSYRPTATSGPHALSWPTPTDRLAVATSVRDIAATLEGANAPSVVIMNSIQCMYVDSIESAPGTVSQVRTSGPGIDPTGQARRLP